MISAVGSKRFFILAVLVVIHSVLGAGIYMYLQPENAKLERTVRSLKSQVSSKRIEIDRLQLERAQIEEQKSRFNDLEDIGFFSDQNRVLARTKIEALQNYTRILAARYNIKSAVVENNNLAVGTGYTVVNSPVSLNIDAMDDVDVFNFIYWLENSYPGHVSIEKIDMDRILDVDDVTLRQITSGVEPLLVKGRIKFNWRTMMSEDDIARSSGGTP